MLNSAGSRPRFTAWSSTSRRLTWLYSLIRTSFGDGATVSACGEKVGDGREVVAVAAESLEHRRERRERRLSGPRVVRLALPVVKEHDRARLDLREHLLDDLLRLVGVLPVEGLHRPEH